MEKKIKYLSIITIIMLVIFMASMLLAAGITVDEQEGTIYKILFYTGNVLLYTAPVLYIVTLILGMKCIIKRRKTITHDKSKSHEIEKFPMVWFIISTVLFIFEIIFIIIIMS